MENNELKKWAQAYPWGTDIQFDPHFPPSKKCVMVNRTTGDVLIFRSGKAMRRFVRKLIKIKRKRSKNEHKTTR